MPLTRRRLLGGAAVTAAGAAAGGSSLSGLRRFAFPLREFPEQRLCDAPVHVPPDFVGMHAHRWPAETDASPAPSYPYGAARSHDHDGIAWCEVHLGPGRFDWQQLDAWVATHSAARRTVLYTLYGTPAWAARSTDHADAYGRRGGAEPPRDPSSLAEFVAALVTRYNGERKRQVHALELWNEPNFQHNYADFWWGTAGELAALSRVSYLTAKAADPGIRVLSPGFAGNLAGSLRSAAPSLEDAESSSLLQFLCASDNAGGTGARWCEGIAFHCYDAPLAGANHAFVLEILRLKELMRLMGMTAPIYDTEFGFLQGNAFHSLSRVDQAATLRRFAAVQAGLGVRGLFFYSHDDELVGNPSLHPEVAEAIGEVHAMIAGQTLRQVTTLADGRVRVETRESAFVW